MNGPGLIIIITITSKDGKKTLPATVRPLNQIIVLTVSKTATKPVSIAAVVAMLVNLSRMSQQETFHAIVL